MLSLAQEKSACTKLLDLFMLLFSQEHAPVFPKTPWHPCRAGGQSPFPAAGVGAGGGAPLTMANHPHLPVCHGGAAQAACGAPSRDPEHSTEYLDSQPLQVGGLSCVICCEEGGEFMTLDGWCLFHTITPLRHLDLYQAV